MYELISIYWPVVPTVIAVASAIAKATPNKTDDEVVGWVLKFVDFFALTTGKTIVEK